MNAAPPLNRPVLTHKEEKRNAVSIPSTFVYPGTALSQPSQGFTKQSGLMYKICNTSSITINFG